ncbi:MAG: hypothetical protein JXB48_19985 [Candidatus Latescibacteria bacterium]|nr:hypothetical protein [Candidatus Latescibacterota bacterium]
MMRVSFQVAGEVDTYPESYDLGAWSHDNDYRVSALFSGLYEYGFTDRLNSGINLFASPGEAGATWNFHYQLSEKYKQTVHTSGLYAGFILSSLNYSKGNAIVVAPEYLIDIKDHFFFGIRYTHRLVLHPDSVNIYGKKMKAPPNQMTIEAITGYRKNNILFPVVIGYNPVFNWWQLWFGMTVYKIHGKAN